MIIRIVMIVIYGVFEFCVDFNIFKNLEIYFKKLYFKFDFEFYLIILNLISWFIFRLLNMWWEEF